jgi:hypothetical protein
MTNSTTNGGIGRPVAQEDAALLTGQGRFSDDVNLPGRLTRQWCARRIRMHASAPSTRRRRAMRRACRRADRRRSRRQSQVIPHRPVIGPPDIRSASATRRTSFVAALPAAA